MGMGWLISFHDLISLVTFFVSVKEEVLGEKILNKSISIKGAFVIFIII